MTESANGHAALGDFTTTTRVIPISLIAIAVGLVSAVVALALQRLIGLFTNLFFFGRWDTTLISPDGNHLGPWVIVVPVAGSLVIGLMARYGSERIRGHGIPEALEAILINGSRVEPRLAVLKPLSSAISIGSGGPFGAEGPIIMTGGAFGSLIAQFLHLTAAERKTLLVAGAAGGMSATFASPVSAVLLAVELLLFEWKPRSLVPVALASFTAAVAREPLLGVGPLFPTPAHPVTLTFPMVMGCLVVGLLAGALSACLTAAVYAAEDAFLKLPIHWMWWPMLGGLVVGVGGYVFPEALGVGYDTIARLIDGSVANRIIIGVLLVKSTIWAISLGSGTSGGVLAPLLMMGGALGAFAGLWLPDAGGGYWALVGMGAIMGGTMRSPFTGIVFALELTHDINMLFPLLPAVVIAHAFTVLVMKRSILTEKVARRGYHLTREYASDPLEIFFVKDAMRTEVATLPFGEPLLAAAAALAPERKRGQHLYPVVDPEGRLRGVVRRREVEAVAPGPDAAPQVATLLQTQPVVAYADEPLRVVVYRMVETGLTQFPVVDHDDPPRLVGFISLNDLLRARQRAYEEERRRERVLQMRLWLRRERAGTGTS
jgi:CIC family chloride channel protein